MTITVRVEQRHIDEGVRGRCRLCPIAMALNEKHSQEGGFAWATDGTLAYCATFDGVGNIVQEKHRFQLPKAAEDFVMKFDNREDVQPFTFEMSDD